MLTFTLGTCILVYETSLLQAGLSRSLVVPHGKARSSSASVVDS